GAFLVFTGKKEMLLFKKAWQEVWKGHRSHMGTGLQITAPKSMMAWLCTAAFSLASKSLANRLKYLFPSVESMARSIPKILARTLKTFPSTTARGSLKANDEIAAAVYG